MRWLGKSNGPAHVITGVAVTQYYNSNTCAIWTMGQCRNELPGERVKDKQPDWTIVFGDLYCSHYVGD